jgi:hypothetical protein
MKQVRIARLGFSKLPLFFLLFVSLLLTASLSAADLERSEPSIARNGTDLKIDWQDTAEGVWQRLRQARIHSTFPKRQFRQTCDLSFPTMAELTESTQLLERRR